MKKIAWVTSIFGDIDKEKTIPPQDVDFTHFHFSEKNNAKFLNGFNDRRKALFFKTQMHKVIDADYFIWTDGKIKVLNSQFIKTMLFQLGLYEFGILKHNRRKCIYKEVEHIENCIKAGNDYMITRYSKSPIREIINDYKKEGFPENYGLNDCKIFIVKNSPKMNTLFDKCWKSCLNVDSFDQISIQYLAWKEKVKIVPLIFKPGMFIDVPHAVLK